MKISVNKLLCTICSKNKVRQVFTKILCCSQVIFIYEVHVELAVVCDVVADQAKAFLLYMNCQMRT